MSVALFTPSLDVFVEKEWPYDHNIIGPFFLLIGEFSIISHSVSESKMELSMVRFERLPLLGKL